MAKTSAQLDAEIKEALRQPTKPANASHSAKALTTIENMGTLPSQWRLTPIDWIEEEREIPGMVTCPTCHGSKYVRIEDGRVIPPPSLNSKDSFDYGNAARKDAHRAGKKYGNCPTCAKSKSGWGLIPQGKIKGIVRAKVMIGYPKFPPSTKFDSRFFGGLHCNLCNKLIMKSHRVPVHATGDDGVTHGMFIGEDCAKKFFDIKLRREKDSIVES